MKFTEGVVSRISVPDGAREAMVFDDVLPGFGVRKFASGKASYFVKYTLADGKQRKLTLGAVVPGVLAEMRRKASDVLAHAKTGRDISGEREVARTKKNVTFGDLVPLYLKAKVKDLRPTSYIEVDRYLNRHWAPLHASPVEEITRRQIALRLDQIVVEHGPVAADRAKAAISGIFAWAIERSYVEASPVIGVKRRSSGAARERVLSEAELVAVWKASGDDEYGKILRLLILTGQRKTEIADLAWPEIDFERSQIDLPPQRTKNGLPHLVPLAAAALEILHAVPRREKRDLLFGGGDGGFSGWSKAKARLDERLPADMPPWTVHDIRRSAVTHWGENGFAAPHVIEAIVNHVSGHKKSTAGVYNKALYLPERRRALDLWAAHVLALVKAKKDKSARKRAPKFSSCS